MAPEVIVDFIFEGGLLFVAVINIGDQPAHKVSVHFHQPLRGLGGTKDMAALAMFRNIEFLAPHKAIQTFLDSSEAYFDRGEPVQIKVDISFVDGQGHAYGGPIEHNLEIYKDIVYLNRPNSGQETVSGEISSPNVTPGGNIGPGSVLGSSGGPGTTPLHPGSPGIAPLRPGRPGTDR